MNTSDICADWPAILAAGAERVGGKAWTLARLDALDFPVPPGLAIPVEAARAWLDGSGLRDELLRACAAGDESGLAQLHDRLLPHPPDPALLDALEAALDTPAWRGQALAVRSSSPQEDTAAASFAGIHRSHLNVGGRDGLARAIASVWASAWTPAAAAYRRRLGLGNDADMAVLVMPLVAAEASGIGFTCDPRNGRDDRLLIHANWGLGESLVGGQSAGDEALLGETPLDAELHLLAYRTGAKALASRPAATGGTTLDPVPAQQAAARVLTDAQALRLGNLLRLAALALDFSRPAWDCEWAWDGGRFWLLQARPVTAMGRNTYPGLADQPDIWSRGNTRDVVPDPLSPMDWSASRKLVGRLLEAGYRLGGYPVLPGAQRAGLFHGRLYLNLSLIQWEGYHAFAVEPAAMNRLVGGHQPEIRVTRLGWRERLARSGRMARYMARAGALRKRGRREMEAAARFSAAWRARPLPEDAAGLAAEMRRVVRLYAEAEGLHFLQGSGGASLSLLVDLLEAALPGEGHALASALLAGGKPSVTAQQSYELIALARAAMADPATRDWLERHRRKGGDWRALPADNPFRAGFAAFLERYGHRGIYETYLRNPRWREQPGYLLDSLPDLAATDLDALAARRREAAARAAARIREALPWWKRTLANMLAGKAAIESNDREAARSALVAHTEALRLILLDIGRRWMQRGWLPAAADVFLLLDSEVMALLDGIRPGAASGALIQARRRQWQAWWDETPPEYFLAGAGRSAPAAHAPAPASAAGEYAGTAVGSGSARGPARLLRSPEDGRRLQRGDILVAPSTDPAWTPLFLKAGGLVMETGGFMSHGAIVAREFGIPAVVNLPGILARIRDGDLIEVDGAGGRVRLLAPKDTSA